MGMGKETLSTTDTTGATFKLVGFNNFIRANPRSDFFSVKRFHHIEFWCGDATNTSRRFSWSLGMPITAKSDLSTGNSVHASYLLRSVSGELQFVFTAPYSPSISVPSTAGIPSFSTPTYRDFTAKHGLGVRAVALEVENAYLAFSASVARGAKPRFEPVTIDEHVAVAEVHLYGDVVLRFVSLVKDADTLIFLPGLLIYVSFFFF